MLSIDVLKITLHSAAAEEIIENYITFLDPGGINYVIIVGPIVVFQFAVCTSQFALHTVPTIRVPPQRAPGLNKFWELRNIYHHHPESKKRKSSEANSGSPSTPTVDMEML